MRKKILIALASLLGIVLLLAVALFWYVRSGRLDLFIQNQIIDVLARSGIEATIASTHLDLGGYKVTLEGIKLETEKEGKPFGSIGKIEVSFSVIDYLAGRIDISEVIIDQPKLFIEFDETGRSNFESLRAPESDEQNKESAVRFADALISLAGGEISFTDRKNDLAANLRSLEVKMTPLGNASLADAINHALTVSFAGTDAVYQGRNIENIKAQIAANIVRDDTKQNVDLNRFDLESDLGKLSATGQVTSFKPLKYDINLMSDLALAEIARVFAPDVKVDGRARFDGRVQGTDGDYQARGRIESDSLLAEGFRISGVRVETDLQGSGSEYEATAELSSKGASGKDLNITSIILKDARIKGKDADFDVTGGLALASLKSGKVNVTNLRLNLEANPDRVNLSQISASTMGGTVSGSASLAYAGGTSTVDAQFKSIDLSQAATLAASNDVTVRGTASGQARLQFPGLSYQSATGRINANFDGSVSPPESTIETLAVNGEVALVATGQGFHIERAEARSPASTVTVTGDVGWKGKASLDVSFTSSDLAEAQRVVDAFGLIPDNIKDDGVAVSGPGEFSGRVEGTIEAPAVSGHLKLSSIETNKDLFTPDSPPGERVGSFEGDIYYTPSLLRIENGALVRDDGSRADFSINAPLKEENQIAVKATVKNFDLAAVVRAAVPNFKEFVSKGVINGDIDLRGLPGPRTLEGTANVTLTSGEFNVPSMNEGEDAVVTSVPEFIGQVRIADSVLSVQDMRLQVGDTNITGQGSFNLDTYQYSVNGEGKNINLGELSSKYSNSVQLTGQANLMIVGDGKWDEWSDINIRANVQGENVALNGRSLGDAKLEVYTDNGILKIAATGQVLDAPQTLTAEIDLRDRANYPVTSMITLNDQDLAPYLQLFSPSLASVTGRATGTIKLSGPLQDTDQLQAVMNLSKFEIGGNIAEGQVYRLTNEGDVVLTASLKSINLEPVVMTGEGTRVTLGGTISTEEELKSNLGVEGEINLRLVSSFTDAVDMAGLAKVKVSVTGALTSPRLVGTAELNEVAARVPDFPLSIARGNGLLRFTADQAIIENFEAATPGGGTLALSGGAALSNLVPDRWRIEARADQVGIEYPRDTRVVLDANLSIQGNQRYQLLSGRVDVRRAAYTKDIFIEDLVRGNVPFSGDAISTGGVSNGSLTGPRVNLDIRVNANETLIIRNNLADAQGSAFLNVRGSVDNPIVAGRVLLSRGTLEFRNDRYELVRGLITLPPGSTTEPVLDIEAEAVVSGYQITIGFSGTLAKLQTTLRSEPSLPEADIISLVLTGNVASTGTSEAAAATQTGLGLAQALLAASINEQIGRTANRLFGISRLTVDPLIVGRGNDPTARVTLGQQITRNLTLTYSQNLTASGPSGLDRIILVEYRISNRFSIVGFRNEGNELGFDVRVRKRF